VASGDGHSDDLLYSPRLEVLSPEDKNLATALVLGTLRWQIALDARIAVWLQRPDQRLAEPVAIALRMGAFQLFHLDRIPAHAALNESVELTRVSGNAHAAGMVNAILRRLAAEKPKGTPIHESTTAFAQRLAHPRWLVERWVANYGRSTAMKICEAGQREPEAASIFAEEAEERLPAIDNGSRLVAELAAVANRQAGSVWDACAAPGGKTLVLADRLPQAEILATDVSDRRLKAMQARFKGYEYAASVETAVADATEPRGSVASKPFDLILADVPCTGTGTLARNPEIRLKLTASDLGRHADRQRRVLRSALGQLAVGGRLVYSTCSLEPEECEQVVETVLADRTLKASVRVVPVEPVLMQLHEEGRLPEPLVGAVRGEFLRTLPGVHPADGFFAALIERVG
jgi:16S rRNA (cytosine967-C5)-methyltransferase